MISTQTLRDKIWYCFRTGMLLSAFLSLGGCPALQLLSGGLNPFAQFMGTPGAPTGKGDDGTPAGPAVELDKLTIVPQPDANDGSPLWVGIAIIYKDGPVSQVRSMDAKTFFDRYEQLLRDFPQRIEVFHEVVVVGGGPVDKPIPRTGAKPIAGFIFVNYDKTGTHRLQLGSGEHLKLLLMKDGEYLSLMNK
ncbi:MAG: hypothetical protein H6849_01070 [Alphaproteobacteria bacterium]|nr:MAG: hypothetical protein H6849_01070 [Alphaproteobacteria bacterium]